MAEKLNKTVLAALKKIEKTQRVTETVGKPLVEMGLIEVNIKDVNAEGGYLARLTQKGIDGMGNTNTNAAPASTSQFAVIKNAVLPESKRGFGRKAGESKYPFATMEVGDSFFVSNVDADGDALKKLTSTVSNMNNKYRTPTGQTEMKTVTKRGEGNKAVKDAEGNPVKETKEVPVYNQDRKFSIRGVKGGEKYGEWVAPADGALIGRSM